MKKMSSGKAKAKVQGKKGIRARHTQEFKDQALVRAKSEGVATTALDLGLAESQIYAWRKRASESSQVSEEDRLLNAELAQLKRDKARLEEEVAFLKKAAAYFAKLPK